MGNMLARMLFVLAMAMLAGAACTHQGASAPDAVAATPAAAPAPVIGDVAVADTTPPRDKSEPGVVDYSCTTDADCAIKDVGNCCGSYPACVNTDSPTFPAQVKAQCVESRMSSVCGFPVLTGCQCVENRCEGVTGAQGAPGGRID
jgi:hypothetical protein